MSRTAELDEFYDRQYKDSRKEATHFLVDMSENGKNQCYTYYRMEEVKYNDGTKKIRPQYLNCWGGFSFHMQQKDEDVLPRLQPYNYERDGDYPE